MSDHTARGNVFRANQASKETPKQSHVLLIVVGFIIAFIVICVILIACGVKPNFGDDDNDPIYPFPIDDEIPWE